MRATGDEQLLALTNPAAALQRPIREGVSQPLQHRQFLGFGCSPELLPLHVSNRWGPGLGVFPVPKAAQQAAGRQHELA